MPDTWAWRGRVLCLRSHSELVTGPQPTPGPPRSQPRVRSFHLWPPRLWDHQDPRPTLACHGHPTPDCPAEALSGCRHPGGFSATEEAWAGIRSLVTQGPNHRETCMRFSHLVRPTRVSSRILLRNSGALAFLLMGIPRSKR